MPFVMPGNRIYHYCELDTAIDKILPTNNLLLNSLKETNDPRENMDFVFRSVSMGMNQAEIQNGIKEVNIVLRRNCKALCFSQDFNGKWGCASSPMWAHYGGNHQGVCLEFDKAEFVRENPKMDWDLFRQINYAAYKIPTASDPPSDNPFDHKKIDFIIGKKVGLENYVINSLKKEHLDYFYFTKNEEWQYEREIRLLHFGDDTIKEFCSIKSSLRNIHLGIKFDDSQFPLIKKVVNADVDFYKLKYGDISLFSEQFA